MKKLFITLLLIIATLASVFSFVGCTPKIPNSEGITLIASAIAKGESEAFYYYKESIMAKNKDNKDILDSLRVNLIGDIDKNYAPVREGNGVIANHALNIVKSEYLSTKETIEYEYFLGKSSEDLKSKNKENYLLYRELATGGTYTYNVHKMGSDGIPASIEDFIESDTYTPYSLTTKLAELKNLKETDFTVEAITAYSRVITIGIILTDTYLNENPESIFKGSTRAEIEITYDRLSAITVYTKEKDPKTGLDTEKEPYKLYITYRGPKIKVPTINKDAQGNYTW